MFRKTIIALLALASVGLLSPDVALAAHGGGGGGGGGHGGGFGGGGGGHMGGFGGGGHMGGFGGGHGGGFGGHGGGFHGGFHHGGFGPGIGYGGYYDDPYYGYEEGEEGQCYLVRRRVHTRHGWRHRTVQICN